MAVRIQNFPKKSFDQPQFTITCPSWWNLNEEQVPESFSSNISFEAKSSPSPHTYHEAKHLGFQLLDQDSSSTQSIGQSHVSAGAVGGTNSQDQCFSSESGEDGHQGKCTEGKMKPVFLRSPRDAASNYSQPDYSHPMVQPPYSYGETYFGGLFSACGPQSMIQPQIVPAVVGMTGTRVPLPFNLTNDGPIYVNAKQYNGIMKRRQSRAKLEARNKLLKVRKPYLHESRHLHALKRVRGSGGRFLSSKNLQESNPSSADAKHSRPVSVHTRQYNLSLDLESDFGTGQSFASRDDGVFGEPNHHFSGLSTHVGGRVESNARFIHGRNQHCIPAIR